MSSCGAFRLGSFTTKLIAESIDAFLSSRHVADTSLNFIK